MANLPPEHYIPALEALGLTDAARWLQNLVDERDEADRRAGAAERKLVKARQASAATPPPKGTLIVDGNEYQLIPIREPNPQRVLPKIASLTICGNRYPLYHDLALTNLNVILSDMFGRLENEAFLPKNRPTALEEKVALADTGYQRLLQESGTDCECDNTHEQHHTICHLCQYREVITVANLLLHDTGATHTNEEASP